MIIVKYPETPISVPVANLYDPETGLLVKPIEDGMLIGKNAQGLAEPFDVTASPAMAPLGLAVRAATTVKGNYRWLNRIESYGDDTAASRHLAVFSGGGYYLLDVDPDGAGIVVAPIEGNNAIKVGDKLAPSETSPGRLVVNNNATPYGAGEDLLVAIVTDVPGAVTTGIPYELYPRGDQSSPKFFVEVKLVL